MEKDFITTRPRLADRLIKQGIRCERTVNPWNDRYSAWIVPLDDDAIKVIKDFYTEIDRPLPKNFEA